MSERKQLSKTVKKTVGGFLFPLGFEVKYRSLVWTFSKHITNAVGEDITQEINVQAYNYSDALSLRIYTNAYGRSPIFFYKKVDNGRKIESEFRYRSEEDVNNILNMFTDFLREEGLEKLNELSEPVIPDHPDETDEMRLFEHREEWARNFIERENIPPYESFTELGEWVCARIIEHKGKPYSEVKQYLLELAAYYAMEFAKHGDVKWRFESQYNITFMDSSNICGSMLPLRDVFFAWLGDDVVTERLIMQHTK
jgi:hypothetical protein